MFSRLRSFYKSRGLVSFFKSQCVGKFRTEPKNFCTTLTSSDQNFNIQDIDDRLFSKVINKSDSEEKYSSIVEEIQKIIKHKNQFPQFLSSKQIQVLCNLETRTQRKKYLVFLSRKEKLKLAEANKKEEKRLEKESREIKEFTSDYNHGIIKYGLQHNSILISIRSNSINKFYNKRLANAVLFGSKIILDLGYDEHMTDKEKQYTASQLRLVYSINRQNSNPFDMYFCNAEESSWCVRYLKKNFHKLEDSLLTLTGKSYLDVFPKEKLVYLSPHAEETLKEYDHNAVYIIGAFVDTVKKTKVSSNKAEKEGIKSYALPLDDYIMWGAGSKSLTIDQVFGIMLTLKNTGDWIKAFQVIPNRKIRKIDSQEAETHKLSNKIFLDTTSRDKVF